MRPGWDPSMDPWTGGALARLNEQKSLTQLADDNVSAAEGLMAAAKGPRGMRPRLGPQGYATIA